MSSTQQQQQATSTHDEHILVVKRTDLFYKEDWHGIKQTEMPEYIDRIKRLHCFHPRSMMETDPTYKQIIPYIVFSHNGHYFMMERRSNASEQRLRSKLSLGIGGHMRAEDIIESDLVGWAMREFHEEVDYTGTFTVKVVGLLNDDSNPVGQVHLGLVMVFEGNSNQISIKSEHKSGKLITLDECLKSYDSFESWSQMVIDYLKNSTRLP